MVSSIFRSLRLLSRKQRAIFFALMFSRVFANLLDIFALMSVGLLASMLAAGLTEREQATFAGFTITIDSSIRFLQVVIVIAAFFLTKSLLSIVLLRISTVFFARVEAKAASEIADYFFSGSLGRVQQYSRGDIQFAVGSSTSVAMNALLLSASTIVTDFALLMSVLVVFVVVDPSTALIIAAYFLIIVLVFQAGIGGRLQRLGAELKATSVGASNAIYDFLLAFREITVFSRRHYFVERFSVFRRRQALNSARRAFYFALPRFVLETALMLGVLALIGWQFVRGNLSDGVVTTGVFLAGGLRMTGALVPIQTALANIRTFGPQAEMAHTLLRTIREHQSAPGQRHAVVTTSANQSSTPRLPSFDVTLENVSFTHLDSDSPAIRNISLDIPSGGYVALVGPSGSGKSTLVDLILGIHEPQEGEVRIGGQSPAARRTQFPGLVSYVPQTPGMVVGTIAHNVALGIAQEDIDDDKVWRALELAELDSVIRDFPDGIHSEFGKQSDGLSGGQKQRLGLARALYTNPRLLVLDEATSALDAATEAAIASTISRLAPETTVIVIAHRLSTVQHAEKVFVIESGRLSASGTFTEVRKAVPLIEEYVQLMSFENGSDAGFGDSLT